jgi:hypothetical protein
VGSYCEASLGACRACADLDRFQFDAPYSLDVAPATVGTTAFYPRVGPDDGALFFTYLDKNGAIPRRRVAAAPRKSPPGAWAWGTWLFLAPPIGSSGQDSGPLLLRDGALIAQLVDASKVDTSRPVLLFDSNRDGATTETLFAANLDGYAAAEVSLPSGKRDADVAAAPEATPPRFFWLSDANSILPRLVTATATSQATEVKLILDNGCATSAVEAPWVTPDGGLLLFAAAYPDPPACSPPLVGVKHLFAASMKDGAPIVGSPAVPLLADDATTYDTTPALTPDRCLLLFSRFDANANGRIFAARRD